MEWSYSGAAGPEHWAELDPAWALAAAGRAQSPIDIATAAAAKWPGPVAECHFAATGFTVENNGCTVRIVPTSADGFVVLDGAKYVFQQAHFHAPSEHKLDGRSFPMEMHLVSADDAGGVAAIGLFIAPGAVNEPLREIFDHVAALTTPGLGYQTVEPVDLSGLIPTGSRVFRYDGSLTTPPCTEGVKWVVYEKPIELSASQIGAFSSVYDGNARPVQPPNGRIVKISSRT